MLDSDFNPQKDEKDISVLPAGFVAGHFVRERPGGRL
jgi:hypothetical protein